MILVALAPIWAPAGGDTTATDPAAPAAWRLRFLVEAGAEAMAARPASSPASTTLVMAGVPGSAYLFDSEPSGTPRRRIKLAVDPAAAHDAVLLADGSVVVAGRDGTLARFAAGAPAPRWRRELGERVASLSAGSGRVIASTWANRVWALSEADGRVLWKAEIGAKAEAPALADGDNLYFATKSRSLVALDGVRGLLRWKADLPGPALHSPVRDLGAARLYCGTWDGGLYAYDTRGALLWSQRLPARLAGGPAAIAGGVAVPTEDGAVRAFQQMKGEPMWEAAGAGDGPVALVLAGERLDAVSRKLVALDPASGRRLADYPDGAREELRKRFADAMIEGEKVYTEAEKRAIEEAEAFAVEGSLFGPARLSDAGLSFGTDDGWLYLFDAATLRPRWRYRAAPASSALPAVSGARVFTGAGTEVLAMETATGAVAWRRDLGAEIESVWPAGDDVAVMAAGRLTFLRAGDGSVAARPSGKLKTATPQGAGGAWLADDGRQVRLLVRGADWSEVDAFDAGGETLPPVVLGDGWVIATRAGTLVGMAPDVVAGSSAARLVRRWSASAGEPLTDIRAAGACLVLQTQAGPLAGFEPATGQVRWRRPLPPGAEWSVGGGGGDLLLYENGELAVHDACAGTRHLARRVAAPPVIGVRRGTDLVWIDARGKLNRAAALPDARPDEWDLGLAPSRAVLADGGFVVKTATGETGFLEISGW